MAELFLEIFCEEIPARMQAKAERDLSEAVLKGLRDAGLSCSNAISMAGPRRLAVSCADVPAGSDDVIEERKGPKVGAPDKAVEGFLRGAGLSNNKALAVRDLAERLLDGRLKLSAIGRKPDDEVIEHLVQVRGIGVWSAQMFMMFKLGRLDVLPVGDLGVQEGVKILHGLKERPGPAELEERCACWRPLASVGAWYAWRAVEARKAGVL